MSGLWKKRSALFRIIKTLVKYSNRLCHLLQGASCFYNFWHESHSGCRKLWHVGWLGYVHVVNALVGAYEGWNSFEFRHGVLFFPVSVFYGAVLRRKGSFDCLVVLTNFLVNGQSHFSVRVKSIMAFACDPLPLMFSLTLCWLLDNGDMFLPIKVWFLFLNR